MRLQYSLALTSENKPYLALSATPLLHFRCSSALVTTVDSLQHFQVHSLFNPSSFFPIHFHYSGYFNMNYIYSL